jgi:DNA-binding FadR family transcriptional regulator
LARQMSFGLEHVPPAMLQLLEARVALETAAIILAIRHATEEDLVRLEVIVDAMERNERSGEPVAEEDLAFHHALLQATHNEPLNRFSHVIAEWMYQALDKSSAYRAPRRQRSMTALHRPIVEAIRLGDGARARRLMEDHIEVSDIRIVGMV